MSDARPWSRLIPLEPFLAALEPVGARPIPLRPLPDLRQLVYRPGYRVTFLGARKAGVSSLLNALTGMELLPTHPHRSLAGIARITYGEEPAVFTHRSSSRERVAPEEVAGSLSFDGADVRIEAPFPLLRNGIELVDAPGLSDRTFGLVRESDLVVLVLSADKILSLAEREAAAWIGGLLNGNVVYLVNRMDLVDAEDQPEVLDWAHTVLNDSKATRGLRMFAVSARGPTPQLSDFPNWLEETVAPETIDRLAVRSRLGVLESILRGLDSELCQALKAAEGALDATRREEAGSLEREREAMKRRLEAGRIGIQACRDGLHALDESFVRSCVEETRARLGEAGYQGDRIQVQYQRAVREYDAELQDCVRAALLDAPVTPPDFSPGTWIARGEVATAGDLAAGLGGRMGELLAGPLGGGAGRERGAEVGRWIGKTVFGVDAARETQERIEAVARGVLPSLEGEATVYLDRVDALLSEALVYFESWTRAAPRVTAAEEQVRLSAALASWCGGFLREVQVAARDLLGP